MKAALLVKPGEIRVEETSEPVAPQGGLLLEMIASATTGTDLKAYRRGHPKIRMPGVFGHEGIGRIVDAPDGYPLKNGTDVVALHTSPCFDCPPCRRGQTNLCLRFDERINLGAYAERLAVPEGIAKTYVFEIPSDVPQDRALFLQSLSCVEHAVAKLDLKRGESLLVQGIGCLGLLIALAAKERGAVVTLSGRRKERRKIAEDLGFSTCGVDDEGRSAWPRDEEGPDAVAEAAGTERSWAQAIETVRPGGRVLFFGGMAASVVFPLNHHRVHYKEIQLLHSFHYAPPDVERARRLLFSGRIAPEKWLSETDLVRLPSAFEALERGEALKYVVRPR